jgi:hypothetical protein
VITGEIGGVTDGEIDGVGQESMIGLGSGSGSGSGLGVKKIFPKEG